MPNNHQSAGARPERRITSVRREASEVRWFKRHTSVENGDHVLYTNYGPDAYMQATAEQHSVMQEAEQRAVGSAAMHMGNSPMSTPSDGTLDLYTPETAEPGFIDSLQEQTVPAVEASNIVSLDDRRQQRSEAVKPLDAAAIQDHINTVIFRDDKAARPQFTDEGLEELAA